MDRQVRSEARKRDQKKHDWIENFLLYFSERDHPPTCVESTDR